MIKSLSIFTSLFLVSVVAFASGLVVTDGSACPKISDHQRFVDELDRKNYLYQYPSYCVDLPRGTRVSDPHDRRRERLGNGQSEFVLVELHDGKRLWVPSAWIEFSDNDSEDLGPSDLTVSRSDVWFADTLRRRFGDIIPISGNHFKSEEIGCLTRDITKFDVEIRSEAGNLIVSGNLRLSAIPEPFEIIDGARGQRYLIQLQVYLFSLSGGLVWEQSGYPHGDGWVRSIGDVVSFRIANKAPSSRTGYEVLIFAIGDPIFSELSETKVILGAKRISL